MLMNMWESLSQNLDFKKVLIAISILIITEKVLSFLRKQATASKLMKLAENKKKQRDAQIAKEQIPKDDVPEDIRNLILASNLSQLIKLLNEDKITSVQILTTYHSRAITIGHSLKLIADSNYPEALELAKRCDETRKQTKPEDRHKLGRLFGIPISIKDSFIQKGLDSTCGNASSCFAPCPEDGEILAFLKSKGMIPFIRSNVPQTLAVLDCVNHIWGRAENPWNKDRSVGGSSGGEGGLIAAKCSPIGLASDALGSIKIPAAFCGVCGFKPTKGRYLTRGHSIPPTRFAISKFSSIYVNNGPVARCVDDLVVFTSELITEETRLQDPLHPYVPWNEEKYLSKNKLRIGYTLTEDFFGAAPPCRRAVKEAADALKSLGHEVVEIKIPNFEKMVLFIVFITSSEGNGKDLTEWLAGEKPIDELKLQYYLKGLPSFIKKIVKKGLRLKGFNRLANIAEMAEEITPEVFHEKMNEYYELKDELYKFFTVNKLDAILAPPMALPAFKHGYGMELAIASCYNWPVNITNLPSGVVPVTTVREGEDVYTPSDSVHVDRMFEKCQESIKGSVGLPVGVQVMCLPWEDEKCLAIMKAIESKVNFKGLPDLQ